MKSEISLTSLLVAAAMFAATVAMHEAARADRLSPGVTPVVDRLTVNPGKEPLGFKGSGGTSQIQENCVYGNDGITRCDDCDVDWDQTPPQKICITAAICYDNNGKRIACP
ncbi:MAG TPA: hypothetical protein VNJ31_11535 [Methyloceanibacter sp.]|nr:hypothetical protein [Methyloceanibacter sp.]